MKTIKSQRQENQAIRKEITLGVNQYPNIKERLLEATSAALKENPFTPLPPKKAKSNWKVGDAFEKLNQELNNKTQISDIFVGFQNQVPAVVDPLNPWRAAEQLETLRLEAEKLANQVGRFPKVLLATFGPLTMRKARAGFSFNFIGSLGYDIIEGKGAKDNTELLKEIKAEAPDITVFCSADEEYLPTLEVIVPELKGSQPLLLLAGLPKDQDPFKSLGIKHFIHVKANLESTLTEIQAQMQDRFEQNS